MRGGRGVGDPSNRMQQRGRGRRHFPPKSPFKNSSTSLKKNQAWGKTGTRPAGRGLSLHLPKQLYQPLLQVLLGSRQVIQVSQQLLVILLPLCHLLAEFVVILLDFCCGLFKFLLGPGGGGPVFLITGPSAPLPCAPLPSQPFPCLGS